MKQEISKNPDGCKYTTNKSKLILLFLQIKVINVGAILVEIVRAVTRKRL